jgi:O-methyltransferase
MVNQRIKDSTVIISNPKLYKLLHTAIEAGLETLLDYQRLAMLSAAVQITRDIPGDVIEFGSFRGGSAGVILQQLPTNKTLHVCDSFEGMPNVSVKDNFHQEGDFADTGLDRVRAGLSKLGQNFAIHAGFFSETIPEMEKDPSLKFSLVHVDADLYESIKECLEFSYPLMRKGAVMIFDDYAAPSCLGAKEAVDEFFDDKPEKVVPLSAPAWGCIIGGGDAFRELVSYCGVPAKLPWVRESVFAQD